jgi:hypothetical protein
MKAEGKEKYFTSDLSVATILKLSNVPILKIERRRNKAVFVFNNASGQAEAVTMDFFNGKLRFDPQLVLREFREIKNLTYLKLQKDAEGIERVGNEAEGVSHV